MTTVHESGVWKEVPPNSEIKVGDEVYIKTDLDISAVVVVTRVLNHNVCFFEQTITVRKFGKYHKKKTEKYVLRSQVLATWRLVNE